MVSRRTDPDTVSRGMISRQGGMKSSQKTINDRFVVGIDNVPDTPCHLRSPELPDYDDKCEVEMRPGPELSASQWTGPVDSLMSGPGQTSRLHPGELTHYTKKQTG